MVQQVPPAVQVLWPPAPITHSVAAIGCSSGHLYTGGQDGGVVRWALPTEPPHCPDSGTLNADAPRASSLLLGHGAAIRQIVTGLTGPEGVPHMLSVDAAGVCCLWNESTAACVARKCIPELAAATFAPVAAQQGVHDPVAWAVMPGGPPPGEPSGAATQALLAVALNWQELTVMQLLPMQRTQQLAVQAAMAGGPAGQQQARTQAGAGSGLLAVAAWHAPPAGGSAPDASALPGEGASPSSPFARITSKRVSAAAALAAAVAAQLLPVAPTPAAVLCSTASGTLYSAGTSPHATPGQVAQKRVPARADGPTGVQSAVAEAAAEVVGEPLTAAAFSADAHALVLGSASVWLVLAPSCAGRGTAVPQYRTYCRIDLAAQAAGMLQRRLRFESMSAGGLDGNAPVTPSARRLSGGPAAAGCTLPAGCTIRAACGLALVGGMAGAAAGGAEAPGRVCACIPAVTGGSSSGGGAAPCGDAAALQPALQILAWDALGRQQLVSVSDCSAAPAVVSVQELLGAPCLAGGSGGGAAAPRLSCRASLCCVARSGRCLLSVQCIGGGDDAGADGGGGGRVRGDAPAGGAPTAWTLALCWRLRRASCGSAVTGTVAAAAVGAAEQGPALGGGLPPLLEPCVGSLSDCWGQRWPSGAAAPAAGAVGSAATAVPQGGAAACSAASAAPASYVLKRSPQQRAAGQSPGHRHSLSYSHIYSQDHGHDEDNVHDQDQGQRREQGEALGGDSSGGSDGSSTPPAKRPRIHARQPTCMAERWAIAHGTACARVAAPAADPMEGVADPWADAPARRRRSSGAGAPGGAPRSAWAQQGRLGGSGAAACAGGGGGGSARLAPGEVVSASVVACDDSDEVMVVHATAGGDLRYCALQVYGVPGVACAALRDSRRQSKRHPGTAAVMTGHLAAITCQVEIAYVPPQLASQQQQHQGMLGVVPATGAASAAAAAAAASAGARPVRLLLTGSADGSLRGWYTHRARFGRPFLSVHPHAGAVRRVLLARSGEGCPDSMRHCVVTAADDGSIALVCIASGSVRLLCGAYWRAAGLGLPAQVSWNVRRSYLACGAYDSSDRWTVAVFDAQSGALDRLLGGHAAHMVLDPAAAEGSSVPTRGSLDGHSLPRSLTLHARVRASLAAQQQQAQPHAQPQTHQQHDTGRTTSSAAASTQQHGAVQVLHSGRPDTVLLSLDLESLLAGQGHSPPSPTPASAPASTNTRGVAASPPSKSCIPGAPTTTTSGGAAATPPPQPLRRTSLDRNFSRSSSSSGDHASRARHAALPGLQAAAAAIALLHKWGADPRVDLSVVTMLQELGVLQPEGRGHHQHPHGRSLHTASTLQRRSVREHDAGRLSAASAEAAAADAEATPAPAAEAAAVGHVNGVSHLVTAAAAGTAPQAASGAPASAVPAAGERDPHDPHGAGSAAAQQGQHLGRTSWPGSGSVHDAPAAGGLWAASLVQEALVSPLGAVTLVLPRAVPALTSPPAAARPSHPRVFGEATTTTANTSNAFANPPTAAATTTSATASPQASDGGDGASGSYRPSGSACAAEAAAITAAARAAWYLGDLWAYGDKASACHLVHLVSLARALVARDAASLLGGGAGAGAAGGAGAGAGGGHEGSRAVQQAASRLWTMCLVQLREWIAGADALCQQQQQVGGASPGAPANVAAAAAPAAAAAGTGVAEPPSRTMSPGAGSAPAHGLPQQLQLPPPPVAISSAGGSASGTPRGATDSGPATPMAVAAPSSSAGGPPTLTPQGAAVAVAAAAAAPVHICAPDLDLFARLWFHPESCIREAAQLLLSAYTDARDPLTNELGALPPQVLQLMRMWSGPSSRGARAAHSMQPLQHYYPQVVVAAAACLHHWDCVPKQLMAATVGCLVEMLCMPLGAGGGGGAQGSGGVGQAGAMWANGVVLPVVAAALLTAALQGPAAARWRLELQPLDTFVWRLMRLVHAVPLTGDEAHSLEPGPPAPRASAPAVTLQRLPTTTSHSTHTHASTAALHLHRSTTRGLHHSSSRAASRRHSGEFAPPLTPTRTSTSPLHTSTSASAAVAAAAAGHHRSSVTHIGAGAGGIPIPSAASRPPHAHTYAHRRTSIDSHSYVFPPALSASSTAYAHARASLESQASSPGTGAGGSGGVGSPLAASERAQWAATARAAARQAAQQLADQVVCLLAAVATLDMRSVLSALNHYLADDDMPLHPLVVRALSRMLTTWSGWQAVARHATGLVEVVAGTLDSPHLRDRPDLLQTSQYLLADLAAALPCVALHAATMQVAVGSPVPLPPPLPLPPPAPAGGLFGGRAAARASEAAVQHIWVYDLQTGSNSWQLPLQPGPDALQLLPQQVQQPAQAQRLSLQQRQQAQSEDLRRVACAGVSALQFSPQGDMLAAFCCGNGVSAVLAYVLKTPWAHKLLLPIARQSLMLQPSFCWLLPLGADGSSGGGGTSSREAAVEQPGAAPVGGSRWQQQPGSSGGLGRLSLTIGAPSPAPIGRAYSLRWSGQGAIELLLNRSLLHRFVLPAS